MLDETHAPELMSWVASANDPATDFPIQNLPFGVFKRVGRAEAARVGVAIGDQIIDVAACAALKLIDGEAATAAEHCAAPSLNDLMGLGRLPLRALRGALSKLLRIGEAGLSDATAFTAAVLVPMSEAELLLPARIGDYSDFYASIHHATNVGSMFRPENPLLPNYKWMPIGYHGRASSIVLSGADVRRPIGQTRDGAEGAPAFGPTRRLDYELEVGLFVGRGNALGTSIPIADAEDHVFGLCLVNDWSARDVQAWEYQPLGPFLAKSFATTVSPWVVTMDALEPFRSPALERPTGDPAPLPHLSSRENTHGGGVAISLEVLLASARMRDTGVPPLSVSRGNFADLYWTLGQILTHHASNGCNLRPGDLLASGTVSGATKESRGCLLERAWRGTEPLSLPSGELRSFLEDGDDVVMRGWCERPGARRIGFGECRGRVLPARAV
ncbi:MAG: fumarylacetoacetase [bacterium]